ncbi:hydrolase 2, exosortase A system-associated [Paucibacter sp. PLA-PC-4]|uniref:hydrolase 2, exosortase A system-associated n=1 Tax=Paucibacter sp. PLA-PC-4 TaxID=2993655 RepID=UPI00224B71FD|nr:hydrolase 2, exosortase A system-associated [Paucibacter sp. PLA-PC-4]MCX2865002.1 hydrolase 2, exosortase A system-associated [Paucibacter sp. PLA-PC-4]
MQAFYIDRPGDGGQRFCIYYPAQGGRARGQILHLHPFAEELNKTRRMSALQARAFAAAGFDVLQIDLLGCGDSSGDFGDASWQAWIDDGLAGIEWLRLQADPSTPLCLWGLRAGSLLAVELARRLSEPADLLLMQAPASGKVLLQQFLRLKLAAGLMDGDNKGLMTALRQSLAAGETVEIAGYRLSGALAQGLEAATMLPPTWCDGAPRLAWLELSGQLGAELTPVASQTLARWQQAGYRIDARCVLGPAFWQTSEIEIAPQLIEAATAMLGQSLPQPTATPP